MSFETHSPYSPDSPRQSFSRAEMGEMINVILSQPFGERLSMDDFADVYGKQEIAADKKELAEKKRKFAEEDKKLTPFEREKNQRAQRKNEALEAIVAEHLEQDGWFGLNANLVYATEYDDVFNGVDAVAEFDQGKEKSPERIALSIDVSTAGELKIREKVERNLAKITGEGINPMGRRVNYKPAEVKYFQSTLDDLKGKLKAVVPVVVGIEGNNAEELIAFFADIPRLYGLL